MYRFVGFRYEITEICTINRKHDSKRTVTLKQDDKLFDNIVTLKFLIFGWYMYI